jgi:hypothetical protein
VAAWGGRFWPGRLQRPPRGVTEDLRTPFYRHGKGEYDAVSILWIILIVVLVLALLGFFSRSVW